MPTETLTKMNHPFQDLMIPIRCWLSPHGFVYHEVDLEVAVAALSAEFFVDPFGDLIAYERKRIAAQNGQIQEGSGKKKRRRRREQNPEGLLRNSVSKRLEKWQKA